MLPTWGSNKNSGGGAIICPILIYVISISFFSFFWLVTQVILLEDKPKKVFQFMLLKFLYLMFVKTKAIYI